MWCNPVVATSLQNFQRRSAPASQNFLRLLLRSMLPKLLRTFCFCFSELWGSHFSTSFDDFWVLAFASQNCLRSFAELSGVPSQNIVGLSSQNLGGCLLRVLGVGVSLHNLTRKRTLTAKWFTLCWGGADKAVGGIASETNAPNCSKCVTCELQRQAIKPSQLWAVMENKTRSNT